MNTPMYGSHGIMLIITCRTEINPAGTFPMPCHMDCMIDQFLNPLIFCRRNRHYRNAKNFFQFIYPDRTAVCPDFIHHIERQHHRNPKLHKLHGKIKIPLHIGSVNNIDDSVRVRIHQKISCYNLFTGIRGKGVYPR